MPRNPGARAYRREDVEEFDRKLRKFHESLAHKERRMLREIITAALDDEQMDVRGYLALSDEELLDRLTTYLLAEAAGETV